MNLVFQSNAQRDHAENGLDQRAGGTDRSDDGRNGQGWCLYESRLHATISTFISGLNTVLSSCLQIVKKIKSTADKNGVNDALVSNCDSCKERWYNNRAVFSVLYSNTLAAKTPRLET